MKSIKDILKENGVELEEEALKKVESGVLENYRSKTETEAKAAKVKDLEAQLAKANAALEEAAKADPAKAEEFEQMKKQLEQYKADREKSEAEAAENASRAEFKQKFDKELGEKKFVSSVVGDAIFNAAYATAKANPDMSISDVLKLATNGDNGVYANPQADPAKMPMGDPKPSGIQHVQNLDQIKGMSVDEVREHMGEINKLLSSN